MRIRTAWILTRDALRRSHIARCCLGVATIGGVISACSAISATLPDGAIPLSPAPVYAHWWAMTEQCSGISAPMATVSWYQVPNVSAFPVDGAPVAGRWLSAGNRIVLAGAASLDGGVVRHEMLHALLSRGAHERGYFLGRCAGVVTCPKECVADAGPARLPPAALVTSDSVEITVAVDPARPSAAVDDGYFAVTVTARNNASHAVMPSTTTPYGGQARTFAYFLQGPAGGVGDERRMLDSSAVYFAPQESKKQVFDFAIGGDTMSRQLVPGSYFLRASYGDHSLIIDPLLIGP